jgi:hypothetical protein
MAQLSGSGHVSSHAVAVAMQTPLSQPSKYTQSVSEHGLSASQAT